ncbi:putative nuclease of putative toxin-antitoxin system [Neorhizobium sp. 2083]|nr:putative nuclease of putative toxin-antitoxin system [Neorhizobium sp. 2083]
MVDAQLPPALARWLTEQGHEAEHVIDCGLQSALDLEIWDFAEAFDAVVITKDEDFAQRKALLQSGPSIVWIRLPNARRRDLLAWFEKALPEIINALERGEPLVEVL